MKEEVVPEYPTGENTAAQEESEATYIPSVAFAFRNNLIEVIEELRIKRAVDEENEEKLKNLVAEKHTLLSEHEDVEYKLKQQKDEKESEVSLIRKEYELQLKNLQEEQVKNKNYLSSAQLEIKTLKEEIRTLQMSKCSLEKKWSEQERKMALQNETKISNQLQIEGIEEQCKGMQKQIADYVLAEEKLTKNVQEARKLNRKLGFINKHKNCELQISCSEVARLKQATEDLKVQLSKQPSEFEHQLFMKQEEIVTLKQQNKMNEYLINEVKQALKEQETQCGNAQASLTDAYTLVTRHVESIAVYELRNQQLQEQLDDRENKCCSLTNQLAKTDCDLMNEKDKFSEELQGWKMKDVAVQNQLKRVRNDYESLMETYNNLEELNTSLSCGNKDLQDQLKQAQEMLNKPKRTAETQVENTFVDVSVETDQVYTCDLAIQNTCSINNQETQVERDIIWVDVCVETDQISTSELAIQNTSSCIDQETQTVIYESHLEINAGDNSMKKIPSMNTTDGSRPSNYTLEEVLKDPKELQSKTNKANQEKCSVDVGCIPDSPPQTATELSTKKSPTHKTSENSMRNNDDISLSPLSRFYTRLETVSKERNASGGAISLGKKRKIDESDKIEDITNKGERVSSNYSFQFLKFPGSTIDTKPERLESSENCGQLDKSPKNEIPLVGILSTVSGNSDQNLSRRKGFKRVTFAFGSNGKTPNTDNHTTESQRSTLEQEWHRITSVFETPKKADIQRDEDEADISDDEGEGLKLPTSISKGSIKPKTDRLSLSKRNGH